MSHKCFYCEKLFSSQQKREEHSLVHINMRIRCDQCSKTYSNHANLHRHIIQKHSTMNTTPKVLNDTGVNTLWSCTDREYICGQCRQFFPLNQYDQYLQHIQHHNQLNQVINLERGKFGVSITTQNYGSKVSRSRSARLGTTYQWK